MLSARAAAKRLFVRAGLYRQTTARGQTAGLADLRRLVCRESSLHAFEISRLAAKAERSDELARQRREESQAYRKANGIPEPITSSRSRHGILLPQRGASKNILRPQQAGIPHSRSVGCSCLPRSLLQAARRMKTRSSPLQATRPRSRRSSRRSLARFRANRRAARSRRSRRIFSQVSSRGSLALAAAPSMQPRRTLRRLRLRRRQLPPRQPILRLRWRRRIPRPFRTALQRRSSKIIRIPSSSAPSCRPSRGVSEEELASKLSDLQNSITQQISTSLNSAPAPYSSGGPTNNIALTQRIDNLSGCLDLGLDYHRLDHRRLPRARRRHAHRPAQRHLGRHLYLRRPDRYHRRVLLGQRHLHRRGRRLRQCHVGRRLGGRHRTRVHGRAGHRFGSVHARRRARDLKRRHGHLDRAAVRPGAGGRRQWRLRAHLDLEPRHRRFGRLRRQRLLDHIGRLLEDAEQFLLDLVRIVLSPRSVSPSQPPPPPISSPSRMSPASPPPRQTTGRRKITSSPPDRRIISSRRIRATRFPRPRRRTFSSKIQNAAFSTSSANYFLSVNQGQAFSTTSSNYAVGAYISASSTIPHVGGSNFGDVLVWNGTTWTSAANLNAGPGRQRRRLGHVRGRVGRHDGIDLHRGAPSHPPGR